MTFQVNFRAVYLLLLLSLGSWRLTYPEIITTPVCEKIKKK